MHTTPSATHPTAPDSDLRTQYRNTRRQFKITMLRVQTKALETLERLMDDPESSGDPKQDAADAKERNRQRLSATQTLLHCRTVMREERIARTERLKRKDEERKREEAKQRTLEFKRSLHNDFPNIFPDPDAPAASARASCATGRSPASAPPAQEPPNPDMLKQNLSMPPDPPKGAVVRSEADGHADLPTKIEPSPTPTAESIAAQIIALAGTTKGAVPPK